MLANYHTHTTFCDGKNTPEEVILSAIEKGFSAIGFSGHGYTPYDLRYCMHDPEAFKQAIPPLKEKYKNPVVFQIVYWVSRFFRPLDEMKCRYRILEKLPVLLPVFWVVRILGKCIEKPGEILHHVKQIYNEGRNHDEN